MGEGGGRGRAGDESERERDHNRRGGDGDDEAGRASDAAAPSSSSPTHRTSLAAAAATATASVSASAAQRIAERITEARAWAAEHASGRMQSLQGASLVPPRGNAITAFYALLVVVGVTTVVRAGLAGGNAQNNAPNVEVVPASLSGPVPTDAATTSMNAPRTTPPPRAPKLKPTETDAKYCPPLTCDARGGDCLVGECVCLPGFSGARCDVRVPLPCAANISVDTSPLTQVTRCFLESPDYGLTRALNAKAWSAALAEELEHWARNGAPSLGDNVELHARGFQQYRALKDLVEGGDTAPLGHVLELGAGPYTHTLPMLARANVSLASLRSVTFVDPLADQYLVHVARVAYREQRVVPPLGQPIHILKASAEEAQQLLHDRAFDTVVLVNAVELSHNAWQVMQTAYSKLRPGGILVFHEAAHDDEANAGPLQVDARHTIKLRRAAIDRFLGKFRTAFRVDVDRAGGWLWGSFGVYFVGTKPDDEPAPNAVRSWAAWAASWSASWGT